MNAMLAVCGINCAECDAFLATQADDENAKDRVAARWRVEYGNPAVDRAYVTCDGCLSGRRLGGHCPECEIRSCGLGRGVATCGHCGEYDGCATLAGFLNVAPYLRATLDEIHASR